MGSDWRQTLDIIMHLNHETEIPRVNKHQFTKEFVCKHTLTQLHSPNNNTYLIQCDVTARICDPYAIGFAFDF
jgi:hypothetical protein